MGVSLQGLAKQAEGVSFSPVMMRVASAWQAQRSTVGKAAPYMRRRKSSTHVASVYSKKLGSTHCRLGPARCLIRLLNPQLPSALE